MARSSNRTEGTLLSKGNRNSRIPGQSADFSIVFGDLVQVQNVTGDVTITSNPARCRILPWPNQSGFELSAARAREQPSRLLLAKYSLVPFVGRSKELSLFHGWIAESRTFSVRLIHGQGGEGKSRFAKVLAEQCRSNGWVTCAAYEGSLPSPPLQIPRKTSGILLIVDYADRWHVAKLFDLISDFKVLGAKVNKRVRILLLARSPGFWWAALGSRLDSELDIDVDSKNDVHLLTSLSVEIDVRRLFRAALEQFARVLEIDAPSAAAQSTNLSLPEKPPVLAIHIAAAATLDAELQGISLRGDPDRMSAYLLRREFAHWHTMKAQAEDGSVSTSREMARAVYLATLVGELPRVDARAVLIAAGLAQDLTTADRIIDDHALCYPNDDNSTVLERLQPDRIAEDFIGLTVPGALQGASILTDDWAISASVRLFSAQIGDSPRSWIGKSFRVIVEAAQRWPHLTDNLIMPIVQADPSISLLGGGQTLSKIVDSLSIELLTKIDECLPKESDGEFDATSAAVAARLLNHRLATTADAYTRAMAYHYLSYRQIHAGRLSDALISAKEGLLELEAQHARDRRTVFGAVRLLTEIASLESELGDLESAFGSVEQARRMLSSEWEKSTPNIFRPTVRSVSNAVSDIDVDLQSLSASLSYDIGMLSLKANKNLDGLFHLDAAEFFYRELASVDKKYIADVIRAMRGRVSAYMRIDIDNAYDLLKEVIGVLREAVIEDPMYEVQLAAALLILAPISGDATAAQEAIPIMRRLAETNPPKYKLDLARGLINLAVSLRMEEERLDKMPQPRTIATAAEGVALLRELAERNHSAQPDLAKALRESAWIHQPLPDGTKAFAFAEESVMIYDNLLSKRPELQVEFAECLETMAEILLSIKQYDAANEARSRAKELRGTTRDYG
jgi:hypothetical protein